MLKRQRPKCARVKSNGEQCSRYVLTKDGLQKMRAEGYDLVADPERYCSFHARTAEGLHEMQSRGGAFSAQRAAERKQEKIQAALDARETMPQEITVAVQPALKQLLQAKLPGTRESDVRSVAVGGYVAAHVYGQPDNRERLLYELVPRDVHMREDLWSIAEDEVRGMIEELPDDQRDLVWEMLGTFAA